MFYFTICGNKEMESSYKDNTDNIFMKNHTSYNPCDFFNQKKDKFLFINTS